MKNREKQLFGRPQMFTQWCACLLALAILATIEFIEAVPSHARFYAWCAWHGTGGQIILSLRLAFWRLSARRIRKPVSAVQPEIYEVGSPEYHAQVVGMVRTLNEQLASQGKHITERSE